MKIAVPLTEDNIFSMHFGHCDKFALYDVDEKSKQVIKKNRNTCTTPSARVTS